MRICVVSDVHITKNDDFADKFFYKFCQNELVANSDKVILLGDIFDVLAGSKNQYLKQYSNFFQNILNLANNKVEVIFIEGNHDVHAKKLFDSFREQNNIEFKYIQSFMNHLVIKDKKKLYFSHGDDIELDNGMYKTYKKFIQSKPVEILINSILPYNFINGLGESASNTSREYSSSNDFDPSYIKEKFRRSAKMAAGEEYDGIIAGHSHVKDLYYFEKSGRKVFYANNGFAPKSNSFLYIEEGEPKFIDL